MTRASLIGVLLASACAVLPAQTPAAAADPSAAAPSAADPSAAVGFHYTLPADWTVVAAKPPKTETTPPQSLATEETIKGTACIRVPLTAEHGSPTSVIVVLDLPFACYGQPMTGQDLPDFGSGAADGLKEEYDLIDPVFGFYTLGSHRLWIERAKGSLKGKPETPYTLEIACTLLQKAAACWMTMAADEPSLRAFENGSVTLDTDAPAPLVPANVFDKPPAT